MYSNTSWAGDVCDRVSTSSYLLLLGLNPISWPSKKQSTIVHSSLEADYCAVTSALGETT